MAWFNRRLEDAIKAVAEDEQSNKDEQAAIVEVIPVEVISEVVKEDEDVTSSPITEVAEEENGPSIEEQIASAEAEIANIVLGEGIASQAEEQENIDIPADPEPSADPPGIFSISSMILHAF